MTKTYEFKAEDIFQDIEGDSENVTMTIPPEILKEKGWGEGNELSITWDDGQIILKEVNAKEQRFIRTRGRNSKSSP